MIDIIVVHFLYHKKFESNDIDPITESKSLGVKKIIWISWKIVDDYINFALITNTL